MSASVNLEVDFKVKEAGGKYTLTGPGGAGRYRPCAVCVPDANLECNTSIGGYTTVCPRRGASRTLTITAPSDISTFAAEAFDAAGNVSTKTSGVTFYALGDYTATAAGHSWPTE